MIYPINSMSISFYTFNWLLECLLGLAWRYNREIAVSSFKADWLFAMKFAERLFNESRWSRSTYACLKASFLLMMDDDTTRDHVTYLMQYVSALLTCSVVSLRVCFAVSSDQELLCIVYLAAHDSVLLILLIVCIFRMCCYTCTEYVDFDSLARFLNSCYYSTFIFL